MLHNLAITIDDVHSAASLLDGTAVRTPLLEFTPLNQRAGRRVLVKFEGAQHTGSFKFRGAYNKLARIPQAARPAGVVAWSSGNHAQGVAAAASLLGMPATIVMPSDAPAIKIANTRALGAEIVFYDRRTESCEEIAGAIAARAGAVVVPPYDDPLVMAGQGTVGLEILAQAAEAHAALAQVLVCCGGGGLTAGVATAVKHTAPDVSVFSVEPAAFDDTARSLQSGVREKILPDARSLCDALQAPTPGALTFPINQVLLSAGLTVTEDEVKATMRYAFNVMKLVIEPGGAVALAAVLHGKPPPSDLPVAVVISGANVDPELYAAILQEQPN